MNFLSHERKRHALRAGGIDAIEHDFLALRADVIRMESSQADREGLIGRTRRTCDDIILRLEQAAGRDTAAIERSEDKVRITIDAEHGGVELRLEVGSELLMETDLVLAQILVRNLLANALKSANCIVTIRTVAEGDRLRFIDGNDGPALAPAIAARLSSGQDESITATGGMGLKLCREICDALGTPLQARSPEDGGAEFDFTLKIAPSTAGQPS
ncbi:ATP-binding protein [Luteolibacter flavescens]|uniref:ATP-binding protein n=1 Tax=Luteolibacter flavescens TaxID=1859460 RepID=A0ABT3FRG5_9BACT|nr:ATP-binding protein [Luteolibacter flavescens]MCW1886042.1 ATP-binding protein [Luteolibacter flavescens]